MKKLILRGGTQIFERQGVSSQEYNPLSWLHFRSGQIKAVDKWRTRNRFERPTYGGSTQPSYTIVFNVQLNMIQLQRVWHTTTITTTITTVHYTPTCSASTTTVRSLFTICTSTTMFTASTTTHARHSTIWPRQRHLYFLLFDKLRCVPKLRWSFFSNHAEAVLSHRVSVTDSTFKTNELIDLWFAFCYLSPYVYTDSAMFMRWCGLVRSSHSYNEHQPSLHVYVNAGYSILATRELICLCELG